MYRLSFPPVSTHATIQWAALNCLCNGHNAADLLTGFQHPVDACSADASALAISAAPRPCAFISRTLAASIEGGWPLPAQTPAAFAWAMPSLSGPLMRAHHLSGRARRPIINSDGAAPAPEDMATDAVADTSVSPDDAVSEAGDDVGQTCPDGRMVSSASRRHYPPSSTVCAI
jgi:hypothetical protein